MLTSLQRTKIFKKFVNWCCFYYSLLDTDLVDLDQEVISLQEERNIIVLLRADNTFFLLEQDYFIPVDWEDFLLGFEIHDITSENLLQAKDFVDKHIYEQKIYIKELFLEVFERLPSELEL